jgi:hypothetical protein
LRRSVPGLASIHRWKGEFCFDAATTSVRIEPWVLAKRTACQRTASRGRWRPASVAASSCENELFHASGKASAPQPERVPVVDGVEAGKGVEAVAVGVPDRVMGEELGFSSDHHDFPFDDENLADEVWA